MLEDNLILNDSFHTSVNLYLDYADKKKAEHFIKTTANQKVLDTLQRALTANSGSHANILVGPYGKGKSHLVLHFIHSNPDYLPVIINGNSDDLEQQFSNALHITGQVHKLTLLPGENRSRSGENEVITGYVKATETAIKSGYKGILVVFDEFSKYLETARQVNTKFLQDFAETANRSAGLNLLLITHKALSNYAGEYDNPHGKKGSGNLGNELAKVEGRFTEISLHNSFDTSYELIAAAFEVKKSRRIPQINILSSFEKAFHARKKKALFPLFASLYPLHPLSSFILPRLSELVAQNERTMFTFLSSTQKNTLYDFAKTHDFGDYLTPDYLYDYFEDQLRKAERASDIFQFYARAAKIGETLPVDDLQLKIVKTIALIYIIGYFEQLPPTYDVLKSIFASKPTEIAEFDQALSRLRDEESVVYESHNEGFLSLREISGVNIREQIATSMGKVAKTTETDAILSAHVANRPIYPTRYNDENFITRYFLMEFSKSAKVASGDRFKIVPVQDSTHNTRSVKATAPDGVFVIKYDGEIDDELKILKAIDNLLHTATAGTVYRSELEFIRNDYLKSVDEYVDDVLSNSDFSERGSSQCEKWFSKYFRVNYELVNRHQITGTTNKARTKVLEVMLDESKQFTALNQAKKSNDVIENAPEEWSMQEKMIFWTFLKSTFDDKKAFSHVRKVILGEVASEKERARGEENAIRFGHIYEMLQSHDGKIGLRKGVIALCIAKVFGDELRKNIGSKIVLREIATIGERVQNLRELPYCVDSLNLVDKNPSVYTFEFVQETEESACLKQLAKEFDSYFVGNAESITPHVLADAINKWYYSLANLTVTSHPQYHALFEVIRKQIHHPTQFFNADLQAIEQQIGRRLPELKTELDVYINRAFSQVADVFGVENNEVDGVSRAKTGIRLKDLDSAQFDILMRDGADTQSGGFKEQSANAFKLRKFEGKARILSNEISSALKEMHSAVTREEKEAVLEDMLKGVQNGIL
jgi:hypothetical protein